MTSRGHDSLVARSLRLVAGLFVIALGVVATLRTGLGVPPWDVLHDGIRLTTPITFGTAVILVGVTLVLVSLAFGIRPGPGTLANMVLIGVFEDLMLATGVGTGLGSAPLVARVPVTLAGIVLFGLGSALYIGAQMGAGPRDSLMVLIATRTPLRLGMARALLEGLVLIAGTLLGGSLGVGTALFAVLIGPAVAGFFRLFRMDDSGARGALDRST